MAKRKKSTRTVHRAAIAKRRPAENSAETRSIPLISPAAADDQISFSALSLHQLFEQQTRQMLDRSDLDEEQKQHILVAMSCPCCGAGGMSYTAKLKR